MFLISTTSYYSEVQWLRDFSASLCVDLLVQSVGALRRVPVAVLHPTKCVRLFLLHSSLAGFLGGGELWAFSGLRVPTGLELAAT